MAISLDLSGLDTPAAPVASGEPMKIALSLIDVDPNQPRKHFDPDAMAEFTASIKEEGILQPISVRTNPESSGRWIINMGERRYRGALAAGLTEIPAFVSEAHTDYAQVIENMQREELEPIEIAQFIERKRAEGDKNADIARRLGKDRSYVTNHLALINPPDAIAAAMQAGKISSAKVIYDLRTLHDKFPEQVSAWLEKAAEVTRSALSAFGKSLKVLDGSNNQEPGDAQGSGKSVGTVQQNEPGEGDGLEGGKTNSAHTGGGAGDGSAPGNSGDDGGASGQSTSWPPGKVASDPDLLKKPLLLVEVDGRSAAVLLNRRPSDSGRVRVRYEDNGADEEIAAEACKFLLLMEQPK